jgi:DNA-binding NtrC family response regulator
VVLTDLTMPRMDGYELVDRLKANGSRSLVIIQTGFGGLADAIRCIHDLRAFWFLEKPVSPAVLRVLLERAGQQAFWWSRPSGLRDS